MKTVFKIKNMNNAKILNNSYKLADGVTREENFWRLITDTKIIESVKFLLDGDICYAQHSDLHINNRGGRLHRDSRCRVLGVGSDWDEKNDKYGVVRVCIYLSDYQNSNSSLLLLPESHKKENFYQKTEFRIYNKIISLLKKYNLNEYFPKFSITRKYINYKTKAGDCVIMDQRLVHGAGNIGMNKKFSKFSIFLAYGLKNFHTKNHQKYFVFERNLNYLKKIPQSLNLLLEKNNLINK